MSIALSRSLSLSLSELWKFTRFKCLVICGQSCHGSLITKHHLSVALVIGDPVSLSRGIVCIYIYTYILYTSFAAYLLLIPCDNASCLMGNPSSNLQVIRLYWCYLMIGRWICVWTVTQNLNKYIFKYANHSTFRLTISYVWQFISLVTWYEVPCWIIHLNPCL